MAITDEQLIALFNELDTDGSGKLEVPELKQLLVKIDGAEPSDARVDKLLDEAKAGDTRVITSAQFVSAFRAADDGAPNGSARSAAIEAAAFVNKFRPN